MRGPPTIGRRSGIRPQPVDEATARETSLPAPYAGWNARGNLASMSPIEAVQLDNLFPGIQNVQLRQGYSDYATGLTGNIHSFIPYNHPTSPELFAATASGIWDVTAGGAVGAAAAACTDGKWESVNVTTSGGTYVLAANGVDNMKLYDGAAWTTLTGVSTPAITGVTTTEIIYLTVHKRRVWMVEKESMNLWYLPTDSIAGAATQFPMGPVFKQGGYLVAIATWTLDSGSGADDYFLVLTSRGEIAVYQGTDPSSSTTWALVGVYEAGAPVGRKPFVDYGGDVLYISVNGLIPLTQFVQSTVLDLSKAISFKVDGAFLEATENYSSNYGWQAITFRNQNMLLVNIPVSQDSLTYQFVMNTITKAWCRFTGWTASCWVVFENELYFGSNTKVKKALSTNADGGTAITGTVMQAYSSLGRAGQKQVVLAKPYFALTNNAAIKLSFDVDFQDFDGYNQLSYSPVTSGGVWGTGLWGTATWGGSFSPVESKWITVPNNLGRLHSFKMEITTSAAELSWTATDFVYRPAGIL